MGLIEVSPGAKFQMGRDNDGVTEKSTFVEATEDVAKSEASPARKEALNETELAGLQRFERSWNWITKRLEPVGRGVAKFGKFLGRLGLNMLAAPEHGVNAFNVSVDAGKSAYKHVSEPLISKAKDTGKKTVEAWGRIMETKNRVVDAGGRQIDQICTLGRETRQGIMDGIKDAGVQLDIWKQLREMDSIDRQVDKQDAASMKDRYSIEILLDRIEARKVMIAELHERKRAISDSLDAGQHSEEMSTDQASV